MSSYADLLEKLKGGKDLTPTGAKQLMQLTMSGELSTEEIEAWLLAMNKKQPTAAEIGTFAKVMREKAEALPGVHDMLLDTCGTGGDGAHLMNISTLAGLVLARMGVFVAKHGNRSVTSKSGSADILEAMDYPLHDSPYMTAERIRRKKFGFMFAPGYHPAMKYAMPARKKIKTATVFNILGPLSNPAKAELHVLGAHSLELAKTMAEALKVLGTKFAMTLHSQDGLDEISPLEKTDFFLLQNGSIRKGVFDPAPLSLNIQSLDEIKVSSKAKAIEMANATIAGEYLPGMEVVALNAAAGYYLWESAKGLTSAKPENYIINKTPEIIKLIKSNKVKQYFSNW